MNENIYKTLMESNQHYFVIYICTYKYIYIQYICTYKSVLICVHISRSLRDIADELVMMMKYLFTYIYVYTDIYLYFLYMFIHI